MSDAPFTVELSAGTPERMDGLCPICLLPSLWRVPVLILSPQGASEVGHIEICDGCEVDDNEEAP